ncbi:MAG: ElyC/SanA/YdcF family protein [Verrucomicrobiota bacterium]
MAGWIESTELMHRDAKKASRLGGMLAKRSLWLPTWKGWLVILLFCGLSGYGFIRGIYRFLAIDTPIPAKVMVVEGWISVPALKAAAVRFKAEKYEMLCTVGGPFPGEESNSPRNYAVVVADQFLEMGLPQAQVHAVPSGDPLRDRTYSSARVLRDWFLKRGQLPAALNVVTVGAHSRRSRLLFEKAFGSTVSVGVISMPIPDYDATHWWKYSEGVRDVLSEGAAYLYARLLFWPD